MTTNFRIAVVLCLMGVWLAARAGGQPKEGSPAGVEIAPWQFERIELQDGRKLEGLIESEDERSIEFMEVRRPQGKRMFLMNRAFPRSEVAAVHRLTGQDRKTLNERIAQFRNRAGYERGQLESILIRSALRGDSKRYLYAGPWFTLESSADEEMTRRSVLRIEQIFTAYRRLLPPRETADPAGPATTSSPMFLLFGSTDEYRSYVAERGWSISNPAFYSAEENLVVAGGELNRYAQQLANVRRQHEQTLREQKDLAPRIAEELAKLGKSLEEQGVPEAERARVLQAYRKSYDDQVKELQRQIKLAERRNVAQFDGVTQRMFARLYHEAFHAYLDNLVYPRSQYDVPRWLNEGLAQVFEAGVLDGDTLRIDAPQTQKLLLLQDDLGEPERLALSSLLSASEQSFLVMHQKTEEASARHYLYSWGLAWYLTFQRPVLRSQALDRYVAKSSAELSPIERFEQLVGMPLADFEREWRIEMLSLKAAE